MTSEPIIRNKIYHGDSLEILKTFPDEYFAMCVTSPPYFQLRHYFAEGQIGQEHTPEEYTENLVNVFREVRRVLRWDGLFWLNLGDSRAGSGKGWTGWNGIGNQEKRQGFRKSKPYSSLEIKPKDLMEIPSMVAMALRKDGWWLRSRLPWVKRNSMPESCKDRPSSAVEYVFQLAKSEQCFYDLEATRKPHSAGNQADFEARAKRGTLGWGDRSTAKYQGDYNSAKAKEGRSRDEFHNPAGRQRRDSDSFFESWQGLYEEDDEALGLIVNPKGNKYVHFATYPEGLIEPLVKCSTSEFGYCHECGAPFQRVVRKGDPDERWKAECGADSQGEYGGVSEKWLKQDELGKNTYTGFNARWKKSQQNASDVKRRVLEGMANRNTLGWVPTCECNIIGYETPELYPSFICDRYSQRLAQESLLYAYAQYIPARGCVLDPFMGSGTTAVVAKRFNLDYVGIDLNQGYVKIGEKRVGEMI